MRNNVKSLILGIILSLAVILSVVILGGIIWFAINISTTSDAEDSSTSTTSTISVKYDSTTDSIPPTQMDSTNVSTSTLDIAQTETLIPSQTPLPTPTFTPTQHTSPTPDPQVEQILINMTIEQKIGQMLLMGVDGTSINQTTCNLIRQLMPGGIVYRGNNTENPDQLAQLSNDLQNCSAKGVGLPLFIAIDHEGQYVTRYQSGVTVFPAAIAIGATGNPEYAYQAALASGQELAYSGVNMVLGPVGDVLTDYNNTVISQRAFGGDATAVSHFVRRSVYGYLAAGVIPVLKHFPGHGNVPGDTHYIVVQDNANREQLEQVHLAPFRAGIEAGAPSVMFGHVAYPAIDASAQPASISPTMLDLLKQDLHFAGIAITDSMGMGAITGSTGDLSNASVQAIIAGEDLLLVTSPESAQSAFNGLITAIDSNQISIDRINDAVRRLLTTKLNWGLLSYPIPEPSTPDWRGNANLSYSIGYNAVAEYKDQSGLLPLDNMSKNILIIGPTDAWGLYNNIGATLQQSGHTYQLVNYSNYWRGAILFIVFAKQEF